MPDNSVFSEESEDENDEGTSSSFASTVPTKKGATKQIGGETSADGVSIEFGHSTGGLDFISNSAGYPNVEFGSDSEESSDEEEDDDDDEEEEEEEVSIASTKSANKHQLRRTTSSDKRRGKVTLYIQMSLAERLVSLHLAFNDTIPQCLTIVSKRIIES